MASALQGGDRFPSHRGKGETMSQSIWKEIREIAWLASMIGCLSVLGVMLAAALVGTL
jgi:hypothetical protein